MSLLDIVTVGRRRRQVLDLEPNQERVNRLLAGEIYWRLRETHNIDDAEAGKLDRELNCQFKTVEELDEWVLSHQGIAA
jgi:hypothetical protein